MRLVFLLLKLSGFVFCCSLLMNIGLDSERLLPDRFTAASA